jgi:hypothetical protein
MRDDEPRPVWMSLLITHRRLAQPPSSPKVAKFRPRRCQSMMPPSANGVGAAPAGEMLFCHWKISISRQPDKRRRRRRRRRIYSYSMII